MNEGKINVNADIYIKVVKEELNQIKDENLMLKAIIRQLNNQIDEMKSGDTKEHEEEGCSE